MIEVYIFETYLQSEPTAKIKCIDSPIPDDYLEYFVDCKAVSYI